MQKTFFSIRDHVIMYADNVAIPKSLQKKDIKPILQWISRISRIKSPMRSCVYFKDMDQYIGNTVKTCRNGEPAAKFPLIKSETWPEKKTMVKITPGLYSNNRRIILPCCVIQLYEIP